jgi:hypothetical protein
MNTRREIWRDMEGALLKKVDTTALFCRPNKRSPDEPSETEVNADISSFQWRASL